MFQSFEATTRPEDGPARLAALRVELRELGFDGFLVPRADAHQGENVPKRDERLAWLTGFTGSAGFCAALLDRAGVFIDGRYSIQVKDQVDLAHFTPVPWPSTKLLNWLKGALPNGGKIAFDPWLHVRDEIDDLHDALWHHGIELVETENLIDRIWEDQPERPTEKVVKHPIEFAGVGDETKRADIAAKLREDGHRAVVLTLPDSICWLLNIRGADVPRTPITLAFAILHDDASMQLFSDVVKFEDLGPDPSITLHDWSAFTSALKQLDDPVRVDRKSAPFAVSDILYEAGVDVEFAPDPCILPKACKNEVELQGSRDAHLRDAVAMVEMLSWLADQGDAPNLSEIDVVKKLEGFRRDTNLLVDISFETICGTGPNGAINHYRVSEDSNRQIKTGDLLLVDSGGQYRDGTTDITRTIAIGTPTAEQRACFTRVLQGVIAISIARFPKGGYAGRDLDALARFQLWQAGQDFDHGTGHGVGSFLGVHEGPQRLSRVSTVPFEVGMILSNEPGYYREGEFGIRTENLIVVQDAPKLPGGDDRKMLEFETITFVPIDRNLINAGMLSVKEREWLNDYHNQCLEKVEQNCSQHAGKWLKAACAPI